MSHRYHQTDNNGHDLQGNKIGHKQSLLGKPITMPALNGDVNTV